MNGLLAKKLYWRRIILAGLLALPLSLLAQPSLDTQTLVSDPSSCALLKRNYIYTDAGGTAPVRLCEAISVFQQDDFLSRMQDEYRRMQPEGDAPEFTIQPAGENAWFYVNKNQERTDITEVVNLPSGEEAFDLVYYTAGRRFFGAYQALIHIRLVRSEADQTAYTVAVYAYPESDSLRFLVQHLPLVEKYFQRKTRDITAVAVQISEKLCAGSSRDTPVLAAGNVPF